jgi:cobalt-zinc-cadmium efflux system membrane fusion protein
MSKSSLFLVLPLAMLALSCQRHETSDLTREDHVHSESETTDDSVHLTEASYEAMGIQLAAVESQETRSVLKAMGKVLAPRPQTAIVGHAFSARVAKVHIKLGAWVKKGDALVTLVCHEVGVAKSDFFKAIADLELARLNLEREKRLMDGGIGVQKNLIAAEAEHKIAEANHEAAEKRLHVLGFTEEEVKEIRDTHQIHASVTLYAPIDGKVVTIDAVRGAFVDETTEIMTVIDTKLLWVAAEIYEKDLAKVEAGQRVEVVVPAFPHETFHGELTYIGDVVHEETRTITVRAEVKNDDDRLKPGMFADVTIVLEEDLQALVVPEDAVLEEGHRRIVFVKAEDAFVRREVVTGPKNGQCRQIVGGLKAGEEVVVEGNLLLKSELQGGLSHGHHHAH